MKNFDNQEFYCSKGQHQVTSVDDLMKVDSNDYICLSCFREYDNNPLTRKKLSFQDLYIPMTVDRIIIDKITPFFDKSSCRVLVGKLIDQLSTYNYSHFQLLNIIETAFKHKPYEITLTYRDKNNEKYKSIFYVKILRDNQARVEKLVQRYLQQIELPQIEVQLYTWKNDQNLYISEKYPQSVNPWDPQHLTKEAIAKLQEQFCRVSAAWYLLGKRDFIHNQLISRSVAIHLVQIDHENPDPPMFSDSHPKGLDFDKISIEMKNPDHRNQVLRTLENLEVGFSSLNGEFQNNYLLKNFHSFLERLVQEIKNKNELYEIISKKLELANVVLFHKRLLQMINDPLFQPVFLQSFGEKILELNSLQTKIRQLRNGVWKKWVKKQINTILDLQNREKEKIKLMEELPHEFSYESSQLFINKVKQCLKTANYQKTKMKSDLDFLQNQITLSYDIWKKILLEGYILPLSKKNVFWRD